jgi:DNA-binding NtrC family response regulator
MTAPTAFALDGSRDVRDHIAELERTTIAAALEACKGNQTEAAKQLGISRRTLIYRMEKHGLKPLPPGLRK